MKRTILLQDIAKALDIEPKVVMNMGCGYDITPSNAFDQARVVHIDMEPPDYIPDVVDTISFLRQSGYEAYDSSKIPENIKPDLVIDVLGPGLMGRDYQPGFIYLTTSTGFTPEGMERVALIIIDSDNQETGFKIITEKESMEKAIEGGESAHMAAFRQL